LVSLISRPATVLGSVLAMFLSACAPAQQWLEPRVCDCSQEIEETHAEAEPTPAELAVPPASVHVEYAHTRAAEDGEQQARELAAQAESDDAPYLDPEDLAEHPVNPVVDDGKIDLESEDERQQFEERHDIEVGETDEVFHIDIGGGDSSALAVHRPGEALEVYAGDRRIDTLDLDQFDDQLVTEELTDYPAGPVELLTDGTEQLKLFHTRTDDDGSTTYVVSFYKIIGSRIGTIFREPIAVREDDQALVQHADIGFLHGIDERVIQWIELDDEQQPDGAPDLYEWNHWEGVYRIPEPPPTAPRPPRS